MRIHKLIGVFTLHERLQYLLGCIVSFHVGIVCAYYIFRKFIFFLIWKIETFETFEKSKKSQMILIGNDICKVDFESHACYDATIHARQMSDLPRFCVQNVKNNQQ